MGIFIKLEALKSFNFGIITWVGVATIGRDVTPSAFHMTRWIIHHPHPFYSPLVQKRILQSCFIRLIIRSSGFEEPKFPFGDSPLRYFVTFRRITNDKWREIDKWRIIDWWHIIDSWQRITLIWYISQKWGMTWIDRPHKINRRILMNHVELIGDVEMTGDV